MIATCTLVIVVVKYCVIAPLTLFLDYAQGAEYRISGFLNRRKFFLVNFTNRIQYVRKYGRFIWTSVVGSPKTISVSSNWLSGWPQKQCGRDVTGR